MQRLIKGLTFSRVLWIAVAGVIAILVVHSFTYWVKYRVTNSELNLSREQHTNTRDQLAVARQVITDNLATIEFQRRAITVRDKILEEHLVKSGKIDESVENILKEIKAYEPEERTNEIECLDLRPPADLIDRLQQPASNL